jgi:hypothetical protein
MTDKTVTLTLSIPELDPTELSYMIASNRDERLRIIHRDWLARAEAWFPIGSRVEVTAGYFVGTERASAWWSGMTSTGTETGTGLRWSR